ncbi:MAG: beta-lactamase family protein [Deltaproteobacteria bacterium]|nr:beta-lactamase family protein [Deltaproteobacteria bacterium]
MTIIRWLPSLTSLLVAYACISQNSNNVSDHQDPASELQVLLDETVAGGIPGISAAIATRDGVVWRGVAGKADLQIGAPVHPDMLFGIGSITKTFIAVVILQLVEEGQLDLNATAASLLRAAVEGIPNADKATIAQLLNHTGGIPSWEDDPAWIRDGRGDQLDVSRIWDKTATLPYIKGHAPLANPGEKFSYANTNFTLLGMIIEKLTGNDVVDEIHRRILTSIGLKNIYLEGFEPVPEGQLPHRYHWATPAFRHNAGVNAAFPEVRPGLIDASRSNLSVEWTAGGMVAPAQDLALYAVALRDRRLLTSQSMDFMTEWVPVGEGVQVGHNLYLVEYPDDLTIIGHNGDVLGFSGSMYWIEGMDAAVSVVCNVGAMHSGGVPGTACSVAQKREFIELVIRVAASI